MATGGTYRPGKTIRSTYTVTPGPGGTTALADITCRQADPNGVVEDLTAQVIEATTNSYYVDIVVEEPEGDWWVRWQSEAPSVQDAFEIAYQCLPTHVPN